MMDILRKYSGILFFYLVIIGMILLINARFNYLNSSADSVTYAIVD